MFKVITLLITILLAIASLAGYLILSEKITLGEQQITAGQKRLTKGRAGIEQGKAELKAGKQELSAGKEEYKQAKQNWLLVLMDNLFKGGKGFEKVKRRLPRVRNKSPKERAG
jgi:uncharacterized phage infection (PIP) family protein YhgE